MVATVYSTCACTCEPVHMHPSHRAATQAESICDAFVKLINNHAANLHAVDYIIT